jgi:hypothetical protein
MVIGSDGKWSKALKAAFIQASPTGRVKMPPPPAFRAVNRVAADHVNRGADGVNRAGTVAVFGDITLRRPKRATPGLSWDGEFLNR